MSLRLVAGILLGLVALGCGGEPAPPASDPVAARPLAELQREVDAMRAAGWLAAIDLERGQVAVVDEAWKKLAVADRESAFTTLSAYLVAERGGSPRVLLRSTETGRILGVWEPTAGFTASAG